MREVDGIQVFDLTGDLDVYTSPGLRDALDEAIADGHYNIVVNMSHAQYVDSAGLSVLVGALKRVRQHDGSVSLAGVSGPAKRILAITGLSKVFACYESEASALRALAAR